MFVLPFGRSFLSLVQGASLCDIYCFFLRVVISLIVVHLDFTRVHRSCMHLAQNVIILFHPHLW
jgi:hypothetical protein